MKKREKIMEYVFLLAAVISIVAVALICIFLFANGIPAMKKIGFAEFLTGTKWKPGNNKFGIFPMILGSIYVTGGALIIGVPVGVLTSIFMARFCPEGLYKLLKPVVNLLAGIPSIVYGFFGLVVLVPFIREHFKNSNGQSILCASILLGIMILPTIIGASNRRSAQWSRVITKERWRSGQRMREVSLLSWYRRQNPVFWRRSSSASDVHSGRRWRS